MKGTGAVVCSAAAGGRAHVNNCVCACVLQGGECRAGAERPSRGGACPSRRGGRHRARAARLLDQLPALFAAVGVERLAAGLLRRRRWPPPRRRRHQHGAGCEVYRRWRRRACRLPPLLLLAAGGGGRCGRHVRRGMRVVAVARGRRRRGRPASEAEGGAQGSGEATGRRGGRAAEKN